NALHTVCEEAHCPNIHECWGRGTATFMVAGKECTRGCRFCAVETLRAPEAPDAHEPQNLADAIAAMGLSYTVITVVNRDDLPDGGARHYRACLDAVHARMPQVGLELLCSDLAGNEVALAELLDGAPLQVFAHNIETVERLTSEVRDPRASFAQSLRILEAAKELQPGLVTKSSIMLGMGETETELDEAFRALRNAGVELLTLGQYLAPGSGYHPVREFVTPERFEALAQQAKTLGFRAVASGPLVRSSYRAESLLAAAQGEPVEAGLQVIA
ncbi:MAG: lipoyl synthase, partial [Candidatus Poseidoniia archaeon]|nr:lipoyl synthase [Candidatus Poseidoniia archaeon]